jgi:phosphoglycolate phosphatase-like HAD superfamily hydrolase
MRPADPDSLRDLYRRARVVFLDCDGVIFDSNAFKVDALSAVIAGEPADARDAMLRYWRKSGGLSRYVKLDHFYRSIVRADDPEARAARAIARFGELSRAGYRHVRPVPEALALIRDAGRERCVVVSGTDQDELRDVFREQRLDALVADVLGSPTTKAEHIERALAARGSGPDAALLVGDGAGDLRACQETGLQFVYLAAMSEWDGALEALAPTDSVVARDWPELLAAFGVAVDPGQT